MQDNDNKSDLNSDNKCFVTEQKQQMNKEIKLLEAFKESAPG